MNTDLKFLNAVIQIEKKIRTTLLYLPNNMIHIFDNANHDHTASNISADPMMPVNTLRTILRSYITFSKNVYPASILLHAGRHEGDIMFNIINEKEMKTIDGGIYYVNINGQLIPVCSDDCECCKNIKNYKNYWDQFGKIVPPIL